MATRSLARSPSRQQVFLLEWRVSRGWTQEQLAERLDTDKGTVSKHEGDKKNITLDWLARYAKAYGVPRERLFYPPGRPSLDALAGDVPDELRRQIESVVAALVTSRNSGE